VKIRQVGAELIRADWWTDRHTDILDFKLSLCTECCMLSFGWFPGVWILYADVSEHSVCSIFI